MNKRLLSQCAWLISGFACIALCFRPLSWLLCAVLAVFLVIRSRAMAETFSAAAHTKTSRIFAAVLCFFLGWGFRGAWMNHRLVHMVVGMLPTGAVSSGLLITLCALAGMVVGYPFASAAVSFFCFAREKAETGRCALRDENRLFTLSALLAAAAMLIQIVGCFSRSIWFDEAFSMTAIRLEDMLGVLASDVHPPLYYYILKAGVSLLHAIAPGAPLIHLAKLVSVVPHICLLLLGATVIRRRFGAMTAALYLALLMGSPNFVSFGYEIRMYSWAMLFVVLAYLAADRVVREGGMASWCMYVAFSLLAAYTHYYACVAAALLYLYILCVFALHERRRIVHWLCAAAATVAGYCPWLFVFLRQAKSVSESYWIDSIGFDVMKHVEFILDTPCAWLMLFAAIAAICRRTADGKETAHKRFAILGMLSPVWIVAIGMIASALIRPVFISRYAVLGLPCFLLGAAIVLGRRENRACAQRMAVLLIGVCLCNGIALFAQEKKMEERADHLIAFAQEAGDCAFLTDEAYIGLTIGELTERTCYHFNTRIKERDMWMFDVFEHAQVMREKEEIGTLLDSGKNVFFIESAGSSTAAQMEESSGHLLEYVGAYPVEEAASLYRFVR